MRFMMIIKANQQSDFTAAPTAESVAAMSAYTDELKKAGALVAVEGLKPTAKGARMQYKHGTRTLTDGPFAETKELIAGFWIIQVQSKAEAIEWMRRIPLQQTNEFGGDAIVELRELHDGSSR